jgi:hypothetical protein
MAITATATVLNLPDDDGPSSTVAIARVTDASADLLLLGDSYIAYCADSTTNILTDDRLDHLGLPQARLYRERLAAGSGYGPAHTGTLRELQAGQRRRRNVPGGYWIAFADPEFTGEGHSRGALVVRSKSDDCRRDTCGARLPHCGLSVLRCDADTVPVRIGCEEG